MTAPAPFSDPTVRNDYYTYDYHIPEGLPVVLKMDRSAPEKSIAKGDSPLRFRTADGVEIMPLYDLHRRRYVVYWQIESEE